VSVKFGKGNPRPMPADFAEVAMYMGEKALSRYYVCGWTSIIRWMKALPAGYHAERKIAIKKLQLVGCMRGGRARKRALARARVDRTEAPENRASSKSPHKPGSGYGPMSRWSMAAGPVNGLAGQAAQHLQRSRYTPVFHAGPVYEKQVLMGIYVVGKLRLTVAEMVDLARKHGFNENSGRDVVA
jgi:hypothetical protein